MIRRALYRALLLSFSVYTIISENHMPSVTPSETIQILVHCQGNIMLHLQLDITVKSAEYRTQTVPMPHLLTSDHIPPHSHCW